MSKNTTDLVRQESAKAAGHVTQTQRTAIQETRMWTGLMDTSTEWKGVVYELYYFRGELFANVASN